MRLSKLVELVEQLTASGGGGGGAGSSVLALAEDPGPTVLADPDAVSGYPPVLDTAVFTLAETSLLLVGGGGRTTVDGGDARPAFMAHLYRTGNDPDQEDLAGVGAWQAQLLGADVLPVWMAPSSSPYTPLVLPADSYTLALRAGLNIAGGNPWTAADMKAWAVRLG